MLAKVFQEKLAEKLPEGADEFHNLLMSIDTCVAVIWEGQERLHIFFSDGSKAVITSTTFH